MKELLERWAALEPERVKRRWDGCLGVAYDDGGLVLEERPGTYGSPEFHKFAGIYVQAAVQEAIEAHEWDWDLCFNHQQDSPRYCAIIGDLYNGSTPGEWGSTPAEALLSAYLTALEAQA
jgi:hypothetical protein